MTKIAVTCGCVVHFREEIGAFTQPHQVPPNLCLADALQTRAKLLAGPGLSVSPVTLDSSLDSSHICKGKHRFRAFVSWLQKLVSPPA